MHNQFPPSSPIAGPTAIEANDDPFYQPLVEKSTALRFFHKKSETAGKLAQARVADQEYPTPNPSSTLGRSSSPVKADLARTTSDSDFERELRTELSKNQIEIRLDPHDNTRLAIGRKKSVCDVVLPRLKNISRQHAFISFRADSGQVKLECYGTNGLVVVFPMKLDLSLVRRVDANHLYELVKTSSKCHASDKPLVKDQFLTSFVLLKGESVIMPYIKNTIIDFRQAEAILSLHDAMMNEEEEEDGVNVTETEDELEQIHFNSDDFNPTMHTPQKNIMKMPTANKSPATLIIKSAAATAKISERSKIEKVSVANEENIQTSKSVKSTKPFQAENNSTIKTQRKTAHLPAKVPGPHTVGTKLPERTESTMSPLSGKVVEPIPKEKKSSVVNGLDEVVEAPLPAKVAQQGGFTHTPVISLGSDKHLSPVKAVKDHKTNNLPSTDNELNSSTMPKKVSSFVSLAETSLLVPEKKTAKSVNKSEVARVLSDVTPTTLFSAVAPSTPHKPLKKCPAQVEDNQNPISSIKNENSRRRKLTSPSPNKTHKKKNQHKERPKCHEEILSDIASRGIDLVELQHVLANHLAFSNVQQVPLAQLKDVNSTISTLTRSEVRTLLTEEKCIGVIYREGKDAAGKPLDEEYYYDVENDPDDSRRQIVTALKGGRSGLRSCRRVHKQYFWKKPAK